MQRILNNPDNIVDEMLEGFLKVHSDMVEPTENSRVVKAKNIPEGKVGVITGGGSGHKPAFIGYVGKNLCDAAAVGEICSSPTAVAFLDAAKAADQGKGVACLYGNYSGDNMNVKMAVKMAKKEGITVKTVIANDDVASAPKSQREKRRGVAGDVYKRQDIYSAKRARLSNNANIACFGAFTIGSKLREELVDAFLTNEFVQGCSSQPKVDAFVEYDMKR